MPDRTPAADVPRLGRRGLIWLVVYAIGLGASHFFVIAPSFAYLGFEKIPPNPLVAILMVPTYLLCARRLPASWERPSAIVYWMLFLVVVAPIHVLPVFTTDLSTPVWLMVGSVAAAFWLLGAIYSWQLPDIRRVALAPKVYWPVYGLLWLALIGVVVSYYGLQFRLVSLSEIYEIRDTYRDSFEQVPRVSRYAITWLGNVIAPIAIARGLMSRRWGWAILGVATELFLVSITGFKQMLFSSVFVAGVVILVKTTDLRRIGYRVAALVGAGVIGITAYDFFTGGWSISSIVVRRMVLTSAVNTKYHFEFFMANPKAYLGYGLLSRWVDYPYDLSPAFLIGQVYYGNPGTSANANIWADAYANFGLLGVFGFTAILGVVLIFIDSVARDVPRGLGIAALAQSAFSLSNTAMLTVFLTHGMLLAVFLVYFMPSDSPVTRPPPRWRRARQSSADPPGGLENPGGPENLGGPENPGTPGGAHANGQVPGDGGSASTASAATNGTSAGPAATEPRPTPQGNPGSERHP
ncbi:oligosaccharide repeat unit polymerase [Actinopolymorpha alba]|uniref:oligosaccharide repeat unit polymerase n=1 Tax=Actinopolymorpha alba TaxID=533267 RepID=UPI00036B646B|nr:oligosaccharide repeat unit polymerase [Actinopolymorpha alba]